MRTVAIAGISLFGLAALLDAPPAPARAAAAEPGAGVARLALLDLRGERVSVRYSAGALQRASQIQDPFELLAGDFARWSGQKGRLAVLLLGRDDWERAGIGMPYGLPARVHGSSVAVAAWGDSGSVELWGRLLGWDLPVVDDAPLRSTADEAASLVPTDLLGLFEGARVLIEQASYRGEETWIGEVVAHTVAATVIARSPGGGTAGAARLYRSLVAAREGAALPLSAYRSGLSLEDWLWFQARFFEAALLILEADQRGAAKAIFRTARRSDGRISRADLLGRYPGLAVWLRERFAPPAPS